MIQFIDIGFESDVVHVRMPIGDADASFRARGGQASAKTVGETKFESTCGDQSSTTSRIHHILIRIRSKTGCNSTLFMPHVSMGKHSCVP